MNPPILRIDAGSTSYSAAFEWQRQLHARRVAGEIPDLLLLLEHPHVFTLGRRFSPGHLLMDREEVRRRGIDLFEADRGGSITYHGPGQLVAYPVVDLREPGVRHPDVIRYLRLLERATLETVLDFGVPARLKPGLTGVWVDNLKVAAIGVNVSRGVTKHGMALNVCPDLTYFDAMVPCGIPGAGATSMERVLSRRVPSEEVARCFAGHLARALGRTLRHGTTGELGLAVPERIADAVGAHG